MRRLVVFASLIALGGAAIARAAREYQGRVIPDVLPEPRGGVTAISDINENNAQGFSPLEFFSVTVEGVAQLGVGVLDPLDQANLSTWFYVSDGTGGLAVARPGNTSVAVNAGDLVRVSSTVFTQGVAPVRGTRTLDLGFGGSITVIGTGTVDAPQVVTASQVATGGAALEGSSVRVNNVSLVTPGVWPAPGTSGFVGVTDGSSTFRVRVDDDSNVDDVTTIPSGAFAVIGFVAQDDSTQNYPSGHYVYPASVAGIVPAAGQGVLTVAPAALFEGAADQTITFTLTGQDATLETLELDVPAGWSWTDTGDASVSGGFAGATVSTRDDAGTTVVVVTGGTVTAANPGRLVLGSVDVPLGPGFAAFPARTAPAAAAVVPILLVPSIQVLSDAAAGELVINEVFPVTIPLLEGREPAEFVEIHNRTIDAIDIGGWTIADIGKTADCTLDAAWAFPQGTVVPAGQYVVVCQTGAGFRNRFPSLPSGAQLFEMYDSVTPNLSDTDDPLVPNLVLTTPTPANDEILLLGGSVLSTNVGQCPVEGTADVLLSFAELVVLRSSSGAVIDAVEYQAAGPCTGDFCTSGITGPDDAYAFGIPGVNHTLGRDASSTDTDVSRDDLIPSSSPSPGGPNVPLDTLAPSVFSASVLSPKMIELVFSEPVQEEDARDPSRYSIRVTATDADVPVRSVVPDRDRPNRRYFLATDRLPQSATVELNLAGIRDLAIHGTGGNPMTESLLLSTSAEELTVCDVQEFDEIGLSPHVGRQVAVTGFVTYGDIPGVPTGVLPPSDRVSIWVQEPDGCGVNVFSFVGDDPTEYALNFSDVRRYGIRVNDLVQVRGQVTEFISTSSGAGSVTELAGTDGDLDFFRFLARSPEGPEPIVVSTKDANDEALEGTLLRTEGTVINTNSLATFIDDGSGSIQVFQNFSDLDLTQYAVGDRLEVTGVITQFDSVEPYFSGYELVPQNQGAIVRLGGDFATGEPSVRVERRVLAPSRGESIRITTTSPHRSDVIVEIYDAVGRKVTTLYDGIGLGTVTFDWDGVDQNGSYVGPGAYICHMRSVPLDGGSARTSAAPIVVGLPLK